MTMTLGELIATIRRKDPEALVLFGFVYFRPAGIHADRGDYSHLALGYANEGLDLTAGGLLKLLEDSVGKIFQGYKGGDYLASERTPVWVANWGEWGHTAIVDVVDGSAGNLILQTKYVG